MHIAETREQAYRDVEYGIEHWFHYFQKVAAFPQMAVEGGDLKEMIDFVNDGGHRRDRHRRGRGARRCRSSSNQSGGFGAMLLLAHEWANPEATRRSFELLAEHVMPGFQGQAHPTLDAKARAAEIRTGHADAQHAAVAHMTEKYQKELAEKSYVACAEHAGERAVVDEHVAAVQAGAQPHQAQAGAAARAAGLQHLHRRPQLVAREHGSGPAELLAAGGAERRGLVEHLVDVEAHPQARGEPPRGGQRAEPRGLGGLVVDVEGLGVEAAREREHLLAVDHGGAELEDPARGEVLEGQRAHVSAASPASATSWSCV